MNLKPSKSDQSKIVKDVPITNEELIVKKELIYNEESVAKKGHPKYKRREKKLNKKNMNLKPSKSNRSKVVKDVPIANEELIKNEESIAKKGRLENKLREKLFCPPFMGRYETNLNTFKYKTVWPCKICMKLLLSETAAKNHAKSCKLTLTKEEDVPLAELAKMEKNMCYPCIYCIKKCRRKVNWLKHLNEHEKTRL